MDVRLARKFAQGAMPGSVNFPLYQPISGWGLPANIRRAGFAFFGIYGTERNARWLEQVEEAVPKGPLAWLKPCSHCEKSRFDLQRMRMPPDTNARSLSARMRTRDGACCVMCQIQGYA